MTTTYDVGYIVGSLAKAPLIAGWHWRWRGWRHRSSC